MKSERGDKLGTKIYGVEIKNQSVKRERRDVQKKINSTAETQT